MDVVNILSAHHSIMYLFYHCLLNVQTRILRRFNGSHACPIAAGARLDSGLMSTASFNCLYNVCCIEAIRMPFQRFMYTR